MTSLDNPNIGWDLRHLDGRYINTESSSYQDSSVHAFGKRLICQMLLIAALNTSIKQNNRDTETA